MQNSKISSLPYARFLKKTSVENLIGELDINKGNNSTHLNNKLNKSPSTIMNNPIAQKLSSPESKKFFNTPSRGSSPVRSGQQSSSYFPPLGKGMFSYPKPTSQDHQIQNKEVFQENSSFNNFSFKNREMNIEQNKSFERFKTKSFSNLLNNENDKSSLDNASVMSFSTSKFDMNKFKITKKSNNETPLQSITFDNNVVENQSKTKPYNINNINKIDLKGGEDDKSSNNLNNSITNEINSPQMSKNDINKLEFPKRDLNTTNSYDLAMFITKEKNISRTKEEEHKSIQIPFQKSFTFSENKDKELAGSLTYSSKDLESRRMTLEYVKIILRSNKNGLNDARKIMEEMKVNESLLNYPGFVISKPKNHSTQDEQNNNLVNPNLHNDSNNMRYKLENVNIPVIRNINSTIRNNTHQNPMVSLSSMASVSSFKFDDETQVKVKMLYDLMVPRVVQLVIQHKEIPYLIKVVPSNLCYTHGLEYYLLEFINISNKIDRIVLEIIDISLCTKINESKFKISVVSTDENSNVQYDVLTQKEEITDLYVKSLNYTSQLVRSKLKSYKKVK